MNELDRTSPPPLPSGKLPGDMLERLIETYRTRPDPSMIVAAGYGRDAAVVEMDVSSPLIIKSDPITFATDRAARYLLAVNGNDIACLGGAPRWLSVVLLLPEQQTTAAQVETLFSELKQAADEVGVSIVGGHTEITSAVTRPVMIGTMLGTTGGAGILAPGGARVGDVLMLTQSAGLEGTALLARELAAELRPELGDPLIDAAGALLDAPGISIADIAATLLATGGVTALHDPTEGGVATAIHEIAAASNVGARIDIGAIPIRPETSAMCRILRIDPLGLISSGALLAAIRPNAEADAVAAATSMGVPIARIGRLIESQDGIVTITGEPLPKFDSDEITRVL